MAHSPNDKTPDNPTPDTELPITSRPSHPVCTECRFHYEDLQWPEQSQKVNRMFCRHPDFLPDEEFPSPVTGETVYMYKGVAYMARYPHCGQPGCNKYGDCQRFEPFGPEGKPKFKYIKNYVPGDVPRLPD